MSSELFWVPFATNAGALSSSCNPREMRGGLPGRPHARTFVVRVGRHRQIVAVTGLKSFGVNVRAVGESVLMPPRPPNHAAQRPPLRGAAGGDR